MMVRDNWSLSRFRVSDDSYTSLLGTSVQTLDGYNGGVTETIVPPTRSKIKWTAANDWASTADRWIQGAFEFNNKRVWVPERSSSASTCKIFTPFLINTNSYWQLTLVPIFGVQNGDPDPQIYPDYARATTFTDRYALLSDPNPSGLSFNGAGAWNDTGKSTSLVTETGYFTCTDDNQSYDYVGCAWYKQSQTWVYVGDWNSIA
jgi:hypothetical protein